MRAILNESKLDFTVRRRTARRVATIALCVGLISLPMPNANAMIEGVSPFYSFSGDANARMMVACLAPDYIDCSIAIAATVGRAFDIPIIGHKEIGAYAAAIGGLSTLTVYGGGASGSNQCLTVGCGPIRMYCDYKGMSGACLDVKAAVGGCSSVQAVSTGYINLLEPGSLLGIRPQNAPVATVVAYSSCGGSAVTTTLKGTPTEVEAQLRAALSADAHTKLSNLLRTASVSQDTRMAAATAAWAQQMETQLDERIRTINLDDCYQLTLSNERVPTAEKMCKTG